ncbi:rho GTPase-activating protein 7-like [Saccoglossus kowalevskii]
MRPRAWDRFTYKSRSRKLAEIEAAEASQWLKAAGFPQYAQMYEDCLFPIDIHSVETDHDFLDRDSIHSLFRRLNTLNKCASMKIETIPKKTGDESDDDDQCALSRKWKFQRSSRRWSRRLNPLEVFILENYTKSDILDGCDQLHLQESEKALSLDSNRSMLTDKYANSSSIDSPATRQKSYRIPNPEIDTMKHKKSTKKQPTMGDVTTPREAIIEISSPILVQKLTHRDLAMNTHERMKGAKSLLKRLDSLKGRKSSSLKKRPALNLKGGINISQPILTANSNVQDKIELYNCVDLNPRKDDVVPRDKSMTSPSVTRRVKTDHNAADRSKRGGVVFSNNESLNIADVCEKMDTKESPKIPPKCSPASGNRRNTEISYSNDNVFSAFDDQECGTFPRLLSNGYIETGTGSRINTRTGSFNFGSDSCHDNTFFPRPRRRRRNSEDDSALRSSVYDNVAFHGSLDSMAYTDIGLDEIEEQLRQEINNLSNLDNCNSTSMPAMTEHVPELQKYGLSRNTSIASMSSNDLETEKQDILNNISQLLMTDYLQDEPSNNNSQDKSDTVSMKSYDTWHDEEVTEDISAISAEVEAILNGINENLCQLTEINMDETYIGDDSSVTSPIPSPTPDTTPEIPSKKIHLQIDTDAGISGNSSCQDTSEIDTAGSMEDLTGVMEVHERRDSGVGSSLSRSVRRPRIRWHSFSKSHRPSLNSRPFQIHNLSAGQIMVLRKLSLLKLTAMMERYSISNRSWSGWIKVMPRFMRRMKAPDYKDRAVFGVPLSVTLQRTGQPLPQTILHAMRYLRKTAPDALGIFRKPGVRTRIQQLRNVSESNPDEVDYEGVMAYDVADMLKQYFRELPEPLLTSKLSETFITIHTAMPKDIRLQAMQASIMLMPDENIEVLQSLLLFLSDIAEHSDTNQMTAHNLAVCFAPSLFHMSGPRSGSSPQRRRRANLGKPDQKELSDNIAAHECLATMIKEVKKLFVIPEETMMKCHFSYMELGEPVSVNELGSKKEDDNNADYKSYIESCVQGLLKEAREKFKGWVSCPPMENGTELAYKKVGDGHPLRLWKCTVEVEAPPTELLHRILRERHLWDDDFVKWRIVEKLDQQTEVLQYVSNSMAPHPSRDYCTLRSWRADLPRGACVLVSTSVEHPDASLIGGIRGTILASRFLIEPCGAGKSRLTHICRLDTRGRSVEWYNKVFGHMRANLIGKLRDSFKHNSTDGPETKV